MKEFLGASRIAFVAAEATRRITSKFPRFLSASLACRLVFQSRSLFIFAGLIFFFPANVLANEISRTNAESEASFDFISALFVFMLATFVGLDVVRRVSRLLHTPLMSLTNAISAIAVVGAILVAGPEHPSAIHYMGLIAVVASVTNIVSGFLITDRMLKMFKRKEEIKAK